MYLLDAGPVWILVLELNGPPCLNKDLLYFTYNCFCYAIEQLCIVRFVEKRFVFLRETFYRHRYFKRIIIYSSGHHGTL